MSSLLLPHSLLPHFLETFVALKDALDEEEKERRRRQMMNRQKNRANSLSLLLLKGRGAAVRKGHADQEGKTAGRKSLSFPLNADKTCPDPTGHAHRSEAAPDQTGRGLAVAHQYRTINHYHTIGTGTEAPLHAGGFPLPQARPGETKKRNLRRETNRSPELIESLRINMETQVGSKGTPYVGHANSVTNDDHGSRSDVSD